MNVLDIQCYVQVMLHACGTLVLCTYGVVCMIVQVVSCACGAVYILYKWKCVHVVPYTCPVCGTVYMWCCIDVMHVVLFTCGIVYTLYSGIVYMWCCVHVVQVMPCTCDVVHTLCWWCSVPMLLFTCCTYGIGARVVLCACHTCCVEGMWYYLCAPCIHAITACVLVV